MNLRTRVKAAEGKQCAASKTWKQVDWPANVSWQDAVAGADIGPRDNAVVIIAAGDRADRSDYEEWLATKRGQLVVEIDRWD